MEREILTYESYFDKVYGGWVGKCLGGAAGAPVEGHKKLIPCESYREMLRTDLPNDDLDLQLLWLEVLQEKGFGLTAEDLAYAWDKQCWYPFNEYGIFLKNYERGILPPYSGSFNNPLFCEGEGSPIRSEIWGMSFPGRPEIAAKYAAMDSSLDHCREAAWIEQFYAALDADAFFIRDSVSLITRELHFLPENSRARKCAEEVLLCYREGNRSWIRARARMLRRYGHHEFTNAVTNLGITLIALLYGENDMDKTINIAFRCGFDTDCTCATAGAVCGIMAGYRGISKIQREAAGENFVVGIVLKNTNRSIRGLAAQTCEIGCEAVKAGGISIVEIPENVNIRKLPENEKTVEINVVYEKQPAIGYMDCCPLSIEVKNLKHQVLDAPVVFENLPENWRVETGSRRVRLLQGETALVRAAVFTDKNTFAFRNINKIMCRIGAYEKEFGIAGAAVWKAVGPFTEELQKEDRPGLPFPHGEGCMLPTLECMVNNAVFLEKAYVNEEHFEEVFQEDFEIVNAYEDFLNLDEVFTYRGQGCLYLEQTVISPKEQEVWLVIGNNDGFKIWINGENVFARDEIRLWTPYNNYEIVKLKEGENRIILKLLRRTENLKFSLGIRRYEGEHFHRKRWHTDMTSVLKSE